MRLQSLPIVALLALSPLACEEASSGSGSDGPLAGDGDAPAEGAIEPQVYVPAEGDNANNTIVLSFELGVTVSEANTILSEIEADIVGGVPGVIDQAEGLLVLHTPTTNDEEMTTLIESLRDDSRIAAVAPDFPLVPTRTTPPPNNDVPAQWTWTDPPEGSNWHLELSGVPQMWNLLDAARKNGDPTPVTVLDAGFVSHPDLPIRWEGTADVHGTAVAGVIAAGWNNGIGIDGVSPHATIVPAESATLGAFSTQVPELFGRGTPVINISLAYGGDIPRLGQPTAEGTFIAHGKLLITAMHAFEQAGGELPVIVAGAGNAGFDVPHHAEFSSPMNTAALQLGAANIIVVEGISLDATKPEGAIRHWLSNYGADISAPGDDVMTLGKDGGYELVGGTSIATPIVAATVAFMYAVDPELPRPTLTTNIARTAMLATAAPVAPYRHPEPDPFLDLDAARRLDAFAALIDLDRHTGSQRVLDQLCDIDDGTPDGNTRIDIRSGAVVMDDDLDGDGGPGDGRVDMRDFRRLRDWLLAQRGMGSLDGAAGHPKRDLNGDGIVEEPALEHYPRGDFNGDGRLDLNTRTKVGGAVNAMATDLEVFAAAFADEHVDASELGGLLESADIHVDLDDCFDRLSAARIEVRVGDLVRSVAPDGSGDPLIFTVPEGTHRVQLQVFDADGESEDREDDVSIAAAGEDKLYAPDCGVGGYVATRIDAPSPQEMNDQGQVLAGGSPYVIVDPDGTRTPVDEGQPEQNHLHYLTESGAFAIPTIDPLVVGSETYPTPTWTTISRNGTIAGHYDLVGFPRRAYIYSGGPAGGAPSQILGTFTDRSGQFSMADGQDFGTSNRHGVNDAGTVVGSASEPYDSPPRAAILSGAEPEFLPVPGGSSTSSVTLVNNAGMMAGYASMPGPMPVVWEGGAMRLIDLSETPNFQALRILGDDGTLIANCTGTGCHLMLYPGAETFVELPREFAVDEEDGSQSWYRITYLHDINTHGAILASAVASGSSNPTAPRVTLVLTPR